MKVKYQESEGIKDFSPSVFTEGTLEILGGLGLLLVWEDCVGQAIVPNVQHWCEDAPPGHIEYKVRGIDMADGGEPICVRACEADDVMCHELICEGHEVTVFDAINTIGQMFDRTEVAY